MDPSVQKKTLRAELRQRLTAMDPAAHAHRSSAAAQLLVGTPEFAAAATVMLFLPLKYEVDTAAVVLKAWQEGKVIAVPLASHDDRHITPVRLRSLKEDMHVDRFGVATPKTAEPVLVEELDLVIVPGLGFDAAGHRIGRGAGFYDRFLAAQNFRGLTCGLVFDEQVVDRVPVMAHDRGVNMLVTDKRVLRFASAR